MTKLLDTVQAAQLLNLSPETLTTWRCRRTHGPKFVRVGSRVKYRECDLEAFINHGVSGPCETSSARGGR